MDQSAFESRLLDLIPEIRKRCAKYFRHNRHDTDDLVQTVLLKALRNPVEDADIMPWLVTIIRNAAINNYRRKMVCPVEYYDELFDKNYIDYQTCEIDLEQVVSAARKLGNKGEGILLQQHGYHYDEIAEMQGVNISTVKNRIYYARRILNQQFNS